MSITKADLAAWRELCEPTGLPMKQVGLHLINVRSALSRAIERIEELERENERLRTTRNRVWQREQEHLESRISTLERLCREACHRWAQHRHDNGFDEDPHVAKILAAVEGES